jgi:hypothetical protein
VAGAKERAFDVLRRTGALQDVYLRKRAAFDQGRNEKDFIEDFIRQFMPAATTALRPGFERAKRVHAGEEVAAAAPAAAAPAKKEATK